MESRDAELDAAVLARLTLRLLERSSDLIDRESIDIEFTSQVRSILAEARQLIRLGDEGYHQAVSIEYGDEAELARQGELRAAQNQHPAEALMAAEVLFDEAAPPLLDWAGATDVGHGLLVVRCLHRAIWRRFPYGAIAYTEALRQRLSTANLDSRLRLSRELHDRIGHGIAAGIQRLDILRLDAGSVGNDELAEQVANAASYFRTALGEVQDMAVDLRTRVGDRTLQQAVAAYISDSSDLPPQVRIATDGQEFALTTFEKEEILTVIQEALHNARRHASNATRILIHFGWTENKFTIDVMDDGSGFDPNRIRPGALGLAVMRERAESLGATLEVMGTPQGTRVRLTLERTKDSFL